MQRYEDMLRYSRRKVVLLVKGSGGIIVRIVEVGGGSGIYGGVFDIGWSGEDFVTGVRSDYI